MEPIATGFSEHKDSNPSPFPWQPLVWIAMGVLLLGVGARELMIMEQQIEDAQAALQTCQENVATLKMQEGYWRTRTQ